MTFEGQEVSLPTQLLFEAETAGRCSGVSEICFHI